MSKTAMLCLTFGFSVVMGAFVFLSVKHIDTAALVTFAIGLAAGVVPSIGSFVKSHQANETAQQVRKGVEVVQEQTNGPLTQAMKTIQEVADKLNSIENAVNELKGRAP